MRIFSGIQPTGDKHLGNYIGGFRQYVATQEQGDAFFCIVDLHSITVEYDPADLRERTLDLVAMLFATGLDPERSTVFAQSHVHGARRGDLAARRRSRASASCGRMTQFKDKADAAGVRLGRPLHLPGADGGRHPPLPDRHRPDRRRPAPAPRAHARHRGALQRALRRDVHRARAASTPRSGARIMDLQEPTKKMSTTGGTAAGHGAGPRRAGRDPQEVQDRRHRLRAARCAARDDKPGISNLIEIMSVATGETPGGDRGAVRRRRATAQFKSDVGEAVVELLAPDPGALPRAARRRARAPAAARARRREGARRRRRPTLERDVRAHGLRRGRRAEARARRRGARRPPAARTQRRSARPRRGSAPATRRLEARASSPA